MPEAKIDTIRLLLNKDKRKSERLLLSLNTYFSLDANKTFQGPIILKDIGGGGLRAKLSKRLKKNSALTLKIDLPGDTESILVKGHIIWCKKVSIKEAESAPLYEIGIQFDSMEKSDRQKFVQFFCEHILAHYLNNEGTIETEWI